MRWFRCLAAVGVSCVALAVPAQPAHADTCGKRIVDYQVDLRVERSGDLRVTELIEYDFGTERCHGIFRDIPVRFRRDDRFDRVYPLNVVSVKGSASTPAQYEQVSQGNFEQLKIGDPDRTITGRHTYGITYKVRQALNGFADHDELYWNAVGPGWEVPVERASARVTVPAEQITQLACHAGPEGSRASCSEAAKQGNVARFGAPRLAPGEAFTVVVGFPRGAVPAPRPILDERWQFGRAFAVTPVTAGGTFLLLVGLVGGVALLMWRTGRDRRSASSDGGPGKGDGERPVPLGDQEASVVEVAPPDGLRPAQVGVLVDEAVKDRHIAATFVDLASRGYWRIEQVGGLTAPGSSPPGQAEWKLVRRRDETGMNRYETLLSAWVFRHGVTEVLVSDLKDRDSRPDVKGAIYDDAVRRGWFPARPDRVRILWAAVGIGTVVVGAGLVTVTAAFTTLGLLPVPIVIAGGLLAGGSHWMPRRTGKGREVWRRAVGYKRFLVESARRQVAPGPGGSMSAHLPYAMAFGLENEWAVALGLAAIGLRQHPGHAGAYGAGTGSFSEAVTGAMASTSASGGSGSSGGGSSGGGGGGGGGGGW